MDPFKFYFIYSINSSHTPLCNSAQVYWFRVCISVDSSVSLDLFSLTEAVAIIKKILNEGVINSFYSDGYE